MTTETRPYSRYIGTFDTPEDAYRAVLLAQADHLEAKAQGYRERAHDLTEAS